MNQEIGIEGYLEQLGLDEKEIRVYLACLKLGEKPIMPIARRAELPRSTVFHILERLRDEGLIEIYETRTRRIYEPYHPRVIINLLKKKRDSFEKQIDSLQHSLPDLVELYATSEFQPKIKFYRGQKEIREIYEEILEAPIDEFHYISEITKLEQVLGKEYLKEWLRRRIARGIKSNAIWVRSEAILDEPLYVPSKKNLRTVRYSPEDFRCPTHTMVYGDNVVFITSAGENIGLVITSRDLAISVKSMFKQLWKISTIS